MFLWMVDQKAMWMFLSRVLFPSGNLQTRGMRMDWNVCGKDIVTSTSGITGKIFVHHLAAVPAKSPGCDLHGLRKNLKNCG